MPCNDLYVHGQVLLIGHALAASFDCSLTLGHVLGVICRQRRRSRSGTRPASKRAQARASEATPHSHLSEYAMVQQPWNHTHIWSGFGGWSATNGARHCKSFYWTRHCESFHWTRGSQPVRPRCALPNGNRADGLMMQIVSFHSGSLCLCVRILLGSHRSHL